MALVVAASACVADPSGVWLNEKTYVERLHGETWFDASVRVVTSDRIMDSSFGCGDDALCVGQHVELLVFAELYPGCLPIANRWAVHDATYEPLRVVNCQNLPLGESFCERYLMAYVDPPVDTKKGVTALVSPELRYCYEARTQEARFQFYVVSTDNASGKRRRTFLNYQFSKFVDADDSSAALWLTSEPTFEEELALRGGVGRVLTSGEFMTKGETSCTHKHFSALKHMVDNRIEVGVIMEDNVGFGGSVSGALQRYHVELRGGWDMVFDSDCWDMVPEAPLENGIYTYRKGHNVTHRDCLQASYDGGHLDCSEVSHGAAKCANFYVVSLRAAKLLVDRFEDIPEVIDHRLNGLIRLLNLSVFWAQPPNVRRIRRQSGAASCAVDCAVSPPSADCENCRIRASSKIV